MIQLFGYEFKKKEDEVKKQEPSFIPKEENDGAVVVAAGAYGMVVDLDGSLKTEADLVTKYRDMVLQPEIDKAVDEIVNEAICTDEEEIVKIKLDNINIPEKIKNGIETCFTDALNLLDFNRKAYNIFRRYYVDGRMYYHAIIDTNSTSDGIKELRYVDPRKIRKVREVQKKQLKGSSTIEMIPQTKNEYYVFNEKGFSGQNKNNNFTAMNQNGIKIAVDSVVHITSGLTDSTGGLVLSYLHKAIRPLNQLRTLEDSLVIYRLARAPERRVWYIDVGDLPKPKAEQYMQEIMTKHKNRLIYDAGSGEIKDDRKYMTMLDDYFLARREGGRGTEVTTLDGGQTLGQLDDVLYFQKRLYNTLNVPTNRLNSDDVFTNGFASEITRDEISFGKFISRLRSAFAELFNKIIEKQVVLKGIMSIEDWKKIEKMVIYDFTKDNYFTEIKDQQILGQRLELVNNFQSLIGLYYSHDWVRKNILKQNDEDIEKMDKETAAERQDPRYINMEDLPPEEQEDVTKEPKSNSSKKDEPKKDDKSEVRNELQKKLVAAKKTHDQLKKLKEKTPQQEAKYRSVSQILARNKKQ